jgi:hypothetical protein
MKIDLSRVMGSGETKITVILNDGHKLPPCVNLRRKPTLKEAVGRPGLSV